MSRFVAVSFLFMGWAFYELSGGADFQPEDRPAADLAGLETAPSSSARVTAASLVKRPVMRPAPASDARPAPQPVRIATAEPAPAPAGSPVSEDAALTRIAGLGASLAAGGEIFSSAETAQGIRIASLQDGLAGLAADTAAVQDDASPETLAALAAPEPAGPDMRQVTANAVNMRGGPGTGYPVIGRMTRGQNVEILSDAGTGWLRLRDVENNKVGWIAASLISRKAP